MRKVSRRARERGFRSFVPSFSCEQSAWADDSVSSPPEGASPFRVCSPCLTERSGAVQGYRESDGNQGTSQSPCPLLHFTDPSYPQIVEIIKTGTHRRIKFSSQKDTAVKTFCGVYGIGSIRASQLWDQGYKTLEDLKSWPSLTEGQKLGIQYYDDLAKRIPRSEVEEMYQFGESLSTSTIGKLR
jgi:hypothetical protein